MNKANPLRAQFLDGLWKNNPGLVQLLGLCPLLAVTSTFVNGLGLGLATLTVLTMSNVLVAASRRWLPVVPAQASAVAAAREAPEPERAAAARAADAEPAASRGYRPCRVPQLSRSPCHTRHRASSRAR